MQLAVIEMARNLLGIKDASSSEFGNCNNSIVGLMTEWKKGDTVEERSSSDDLGGSMRLGAYQAIFEKKFKSLRSLWFRKY